MTLCAWMLTGRLFLVSKSVSSHMSPIQSMYFCAAVIHSCVLLWVAGSSQFVPSYDDHVLSHWFDHVNCWFKSELGL